MAKWGLFSGNLPDPMQTVDAARMAQNGDHVYFYNDVGQHKEEQVAAIKLGPGQVVKKISG